MYVAATADVAAVAVGAAEAVPLVSLAAVVVPSSNSSSNAVGGRAAIAAEAAVV